MAEQMASITIRLSASHMRALKARAKARGLKPAPYIRSLLSDLLDGEGREDMDQALSTLTQGVDALRHGLAKATAAILSDLQTTTKADKKKVLSQEYIREWVGDNILR